MSKLSETTLGELADLIAARVVAAMRDDAGFAAEDQAEAKSVVQELITTGTSESYTLAQLEAMERDELVAIAAELDLTHTPKARKPTIIDAILAAVESVEDEDEDEDEDEETEPETDDEEVEDDEDEEEDDDETSDSDADDEEDDEEDESDDEDDEEEDEDESDDAPADDEDDDDFWTEDELNEKSLGELRAIAKDYDIDSKGMNKEAIITAILSD